MKKWAIIEDVSVFIPGDERSRTNPGHGYPDSYEKYTTYKEYDNYEKLMSVIELKIKTRSKFKVIEVRELAVEQKVSLSLGEGSNSD